MTPLLIVVVVAWALLCLLIDRSQARMYRELRRASDTLESCRVLLKHIAENMQRGERVDIARLFMKESLARALGSTDPEETKTGSKIIVP